jgi:hypothetical protein
LRAIAEVFPGIPDFICHFHFLRDLGKDLLGADYDSLRKWLQSQGLVGNLRAQLRTWRKQIQADPPLQQALEQLPAGAWPNSALAHAPLLAAYLLAHWVLAGLQQGQGYGFPFDRPLLTLAQRAQQACAQLQSLLAGPLPKDWLRYMPLNNLACQLHHLAKAPALKGPLDRLEKYSRLFDQLRDTLRIAPLRAHQGLNHDGEPVEMKTLQQQVQAFSQQVRTGPDYPTTPAFQKMIEQIDHYGPKLFAAPLVVSTPQGPRTIQPQRTNNIMERFFRDLKRDCRHKTGCHSLGRSLQGMLPDTPLVKNLQNPDYLKILLDGHPCLEALFAQIDSAAVREELARSHEKPERVPRRLQRFIAGLPDSTPIKNFIKTVQANPLSSP